MALQVLDTDHDGRSFCPRQLFFAPAGENEGWARLATNLKAEMEAYRGTVSLPFEAGSTSVWPSRSWTTGAVKV